jgi:DNA-binding transcriptional MerR regulator
MTYKEILKLLEAGYTRDEINEMHEQEIQQPDPEPAPDPKQPAPDPKQPAPPAHEQPGLDAQSAIAALLGKMDQKLTELQAANILAMQQPGGQEKEKTPEDILGELMRPEPRK